MDPAVQLHERSPFLSGQTCLRMHVVKEMSQPARDAAVPASPKATEESLGVGGVGQLRRSWILCGPLE